jgi:phospholipid-binding lipoprotein MlaA
MYGNPLLMVNRLIVAILAVFLLGTAQSTVAADPWETMNRKTYAFNESLDRYLLKPVATGYDKILPDAVQNRVSSFFSNLLDLNTVVNDLLQGKFRQASRDFSRFFVNSTLGLAGFFDVAKDMGLPQSDREDFGQTLAVWGWNNDRYLMLPFIGPATITSTMGMPVNSAINPISYVDHIPTRNTLYGTSILDLRAKLLSVEDLMSRDKYAFMRDTYLQRREYLIKDGAVTDDFGVENDEFGGGEF